MVDLTEQMSLNIQQFQTEEFYLQIVGQEGLQTPLHIHPSSLVGDFYFPVSDGTLPIDKAALLDVWKEIMFGVARDPMLRAQYSLGKMFEWVAELGGARNISNFKLDPSTPEGQQELEIAMAMRNGRQGNTDRSGEGGS
jgi:hypothetical protein